MLLLNKLTEPGNIKRIELNPDTIHIETADGKNLLYRLVSTTAKEEHHNAQDIIPT